MISSGFSLHPLEGIISSVCAPLFKMEICSRRILFNFSRSLVCGHLNVAHIAHSSNDTESGLQALLASCFNGKAAHGYESGQNKTPRGIDWRFWIDASSVDCNNWRTKARDSVQA